jgi:hypothetical protein
MKRDYFCIYPVGINDLCEEELTVFDVFEDWEDLKGINEEDVLEKVMFKIIEKLTS